MADAQGRTGNGSVRRWVSLRMGSGGRERERSGQDDIQASAANFDDHYPLTMVKVVKFTNTLCLLTTFGGQSEASDWGERMSAGGLPWNIGLTSPMMELGGVIRSLGEEAVFLHTSGGVGELLASCLIVLMGVGASLSPLPAGARVLARAATSSLSLII